MNRKFLGMAGVGALLVGGLAASHLALAQPDHDRPGGRQGEMMAKMDANHDGKISKAELTAALDARFARMDANHDGKLTKEDWALNREARLDERFAAMDADHNGQISKAEFKAAHQGPGPEGRDDQGFGRRGHHRFGGGMMFGGRGGPMAEAMKDGGVTRAEFMARPLAMFDKADSNKDGVVTADEMKAAREAMRDAWQARRGGEAPDRN